MLFRNRLKLGLFKFRFMMTIITNEMIFAPSVLTIEMNEGSFHFKVQIYLNTDMRIGLECEVVSIQN
jgi:hypothetical protein